jgi:penicillin-binding protein 2
MNEEGPPLGFVSLPPVDPNLEAQLSDKPPLRDDDVGFAAGKIAIFQYSTVAIFLFLISGFWRLQVQNPQFYDERALANSIKSVPLTAPRGRILDRDGRVIVDNHSSFVLYLTRENLKEEHILPIAQGLDLDYKDLMLKVQRFKSRPKYEPIVLKRELSPADLAFVYSHVDFFPELLVTQSQRRLYPQNGMMAHVIGYTGEISEQELDLPEFAKYSAGDVIGKFGIEREYNSTLMGVDGQRQVIVDNRGQVRQKLAEKPAVPGKDLQLTIDLDLQAVAELTMEGKNGSVVALDPRTGEVLAMVSRPTFDPNKFAERVKAKDWKEITDNPDHPLMNRAIQAQQAPGSTFKPIVALAGLESGAIDDKFGVHCSGGVALYGRYQRCWWKPGHGAVALHSGIVHSCDVYFYTIGAKMGIENIAYYADLVGFGKPSGIDLPQEKDGTVPSPQWKLRYYRQKWYAGETPSVAIGQGALTVTPLQLARAIGGLAIGGIWHHPHLREELTKTDQPVTWALNPDNVKDVIDGMYGVVNEGGTGVRARLPNVEVCGKTGSAQLASNDFVKGAGAGRKNLKDNAWFVGFAPRQNPEIVVAALFEHGEHGQFAAPIVRDVMKAYFDKKARTAQAAQMTAKLNSFSVTPGTTPQPATTPAVSDDQLIVQSGISSEVPPGNDAPPPPPPAQVPAVTPGTPAPNGAKPAAGQPPASLPKAAPPRPAATPASKGAPPRPPV